MDIECEGLSGGLDPNCEEEDESDSSGVWM